MGGGARLGGPGGGACACPQAPMGTYQRQSAAWRHGRGSAHRSGGCCSRGKCCRSRCGSARVLAAKVRDLADVGGMMESRLTVIGSSSNKGRRWRVCEGVAERQPKLTGRTEGSRGRDSRSNALVPDLQVGLVRVINQTSSVIEKLILGNDEHKGWMEMGKEKLGARSGVALATPFSAGLGPVTRDLESALLKPHTDAHICPVLSHVVHAA